MKNNRIHIVPIVLILSIIGGLIILGASYTVPFHTNSTNLGISPEALASLQRGETLLFIGRMLLIILVVIDFVGLVYIIQYKDKLCPKCQTPLPKWRIPKNGYEAFIGGWTCPGCGTKLTWQLRERK